MDAILKRYVDKRIFDQTRPVISDSYRFAVKDYPSLKPFTLSFEQSVFLEKSNALGYEFVFTGEKRTCANLNVEILFCWDAKQAPSVLLQSAGKFERNIPEAITRIDKEQEIGDFGLAWAWDSSTKAVFFMRNNVIVGLYGTCVGDELLAIAKEIDTSLTRQKSIRQYTEEKGKFFAKVKEKKVKTGERLDIGTAPYKNETVYFQTTSGSVNRDIAKPELWYYRAGGEKGKQTITLFHLGEGRVPKMEKLVIEII